MPRINSAIAILIVLLGFGSTVGCGGGSNTSTVRILGTLSSSGTVSVAYGPSTLTASGGTGPYTWTANNLPTGVAVQGSLTSPSIVIGGTPAATGSFNVQAAVSDSASHSANYNVTVNISAPGALAVSTSSLPTGSVGTAYPSTTLAAISGTPPYTWTEKSGGAPPDGLTFAATGAISGTPTRAGEFGPYVFTVTDHVGATADSPSMTIGIAGAASACGPSPEPRGNEAALTAPFAFLMAGSSGFVDDILIPVSLVASFTPNGTGGVTGGTLDFVAADEVLTFQVVSGSYSYGSDGRGCLSLGLAFTPAAAPHRLSIAGNSNRKHANGRKKAARIPHGSSGVTNAATFSFSLGQNNKSGRIQQFDYNAFDYDFTSQVAAAGNIHIQTPADFSRSKLATHFAFGAAGWFTDSEFLFRAAIAGSTTNSNGTLSNSFADDNINGAPSGELSGGSGSLSEVSSTTGRGEGSYTIQDNGSPLTFNFVYYVLNQNDFLILTTDNPAELGALQLTGRAIASSSSPPVPNGYYMFGASGFDVGLFGSVAAVGTAHLTNSNAVPTATIYQNDAGIVGTKTFTNGSYALEAASGRISLTLVGTQPPIAYETADNSEDDIVAFLVGTDPTTTSGFLMLQSTTAPNFGASTLSGSFALGSTEDINGQTGSIVGIFSFDGANHYTAISDIVDVFHAGLDHDVSASGTTAVNQDGSGSIDESNETIVTNGSYILVIDTGDNFEPLLYVAVKR
jgi:hypothetical protein